MTKHKGRPLTADEIREHVVRHVDCAKYKAADFDWYFRQKLPLSVLKSHPEGTGPLGSSPGNWIRWLASERASGDWGDDFASWWESAPGRERPPLVVTEGARGFLVEDGNHRVAVSHEYVMRDVPAYVGYRKEEREVHK